MLYGALGRTNPCTRRSAGLVALALTAVLGRAHGQSEVSGCEFTHGDGRVERFGNGFLIFAEGGRVIMQCDRFNVGPGNGVEFRQDGATARLLNRINGDFGPSDINGSLTANGIIFIVNPAGVFFGNGALVNVGGIYAASGNITDSDFLADTYRFDTSAGDMVRVDPGANIAATQMVHLIGQQVANHGDISVGTGTVALIAANDEVIITEMGERISVQVDGVNLDRDLRIGAPETPVLTGDVGVENTGSIEVTSGQVVLGASDMYALAIRNTGDILVGGNDGAAQLTALAGTVLHEGSIRAADVAMTGGVIFLDDDVQADEALFNDAVVLGSDITIEGTDGSATNVEFVSTVDSETDEENGLAVDSADTRFRDDVGGTERLGALDVTGRALLEGGLVSTTGLQRYGGAVTLGADTTMNAGDTFVTGVRFDDAVDSAAGENYGLVLDAATTFGGAVGGTDELSTLDVSGPTRIDGGRITTTGTQVFGGAVVLGADTRLDAESVEFVETVDSAAGETHALDVNAADTRFGGVVGGTDELSELDVSGRARIDGGRIATTEAQVFGGAVVLGADTTLDAESVEFVETVDSAAGETHALDVNAADTRFGGLVGGTDELSTLDVSGRARIDGGRITTTGLQRYGGAVTLGAVTRLDAGDTFATGVRFDDTVDSAAGEHYGLVLNAATTFGGSVGSGEDQELGSLDVNGLAMIGTDAIDEIFVETTALQRYRRGVTLGANATLEAGGTFGTGVQFDSTVDSTANDAHTLTVQAATTFGGSVGSGENQELGSLDVDGLAMIGTDAIDDISVETTGLQRYRRVTLGANATLEAGNTFGTGVRFDSTVDSTANDAHTLTVQAATTFGGSVGSGENQELGSLDVDGLAMIGTDAIDDISVETTGSQRYRRDVTLGANATLTAGMSSVRFDGSVDGGGNDLTVVAATGITLGDSDEDELTDVRALAMTAGTTNEGDGIWTLINASLLQVDTAVFNDAVRLGSDVRIEGTSGDATSVSFVGLFATVDSAEGQANSLVIRSADTTFGMAVGATDALSSLDVSGDAQIDGGSITTVGLQRYGGAVTLGADTTTLTTTDAGAGRVEFGSTVDSASGQTNRLEIQSADTTFGGAVGATDALSSLDVSGQALIDGGSVRTTGAQAYGGAVTLGRDTTTLTTLDEDTGSVTFGSTVDSEAGATNRLEISSADTTFGGAVGATDALSSLDVSGRARIDGGRIATTGTQVYGGAVVLGADTRLDAESVEFVMTVDSVEDETHALDVNAADTRFGGVVGGTDELSELDVSGRARIDGGRIATTGSQVYGGAVVLGTDTTLDAGSVRFVETVDSAAGETHALDVNAAVTRFGGVVGGDDELSMLDVSGRARIDGGRITTTGSQVYGGAVTLGADTRLDAESVEFVMTVDSAEDETHALDVNAADTRFGGVVGGTDELSELDVSGRAQIDGGVINSAGRQRYRDTVTLGADTRLSSDEGVVRFDGRVDGDGHSLTVEAGTNARFEGRITDTGEIMVNAGKNAKFERRITDTGAFTVEAGNDATFQGRIDDTGAFTVAASNDVTFHKGIGERTKVESLAVTAGKSGRITFEAKNQQIVASGDIVLNETNPITHDGVHKKPGSEATILSTGGGTFTISSKDGGEFRMGRNEKMSVEGNLTIKGSSPIKTAYLSDINTLGDLEVDANEIVILLRGSGPAFAPGDPTEREDQGVDFVAGGEFFFTYTNLELDGSGGDPQFATPDGQGDANGTLSQFVMRSFGSSFQNFVVKGVERDLLATGASTTDPAQARAAAPTRETELADVRDQNPFPAGLDRELAEQLAILPRLLSPVEIAARLDGRYLYFDEWPTLVNPNAQDYHEVVIYRLGWQAVEALDNYQALRGRESQIRDRLGDAVFAYREEFGDDAALGGLGASLLAQEDYRDLVEDLQRLNLVLASIDEIGITSSELERPRRVILENFRPKEEIDSPEELLEVLRTLPETPSALDEAAPVSGDDAEATG